MQRVGRRDTDAEVLLVACLRRRGLRFRRDAPPITGIRRRADILFLRARLAVYVDGCFWHACPQHATWPKAHAAWWKAKLEGNVLRDRDTDRMLRGAGWRVVHVWSHDDPERAAARIARRVAPPGQQPQHSAAL
jgi:DNA mismatch endonuclease, patch repair protein